MSIENERNQVIVERGRTICLLSGLNHVLAYKSSAVFHTRTEFHSVYGFMEILRVGTHRAYVWRITNYDVNSADCIDLF